MDQFGIELRRLRGAAGEGTAADHYEETGPNAGGWSQVTDPRGNVTGYVFDRADRLTQANEPLSTTTSYAYDPGGSLTSVTDPRGNQTSFVYDELSRLTQINQPLSKQTSFTYDPAGNLSSRTTATETRNYAYDDANRLTSVSQGGSTLRSFEYDAADRLTTATDAQQKQITVGYNADDLPTSINDDRGQSATLTYDSRGNLTRQVDGRGTVDVAYNDRSWMTRLTDPQSQILDFTYDSEGNLTSIQRPNGSVTTNTYDSDARLTQTATEKAGQTLESLGYTYDAAGNRTSQTDRLGQVTTYAYDALNRITEFDPAQAGATTYAYDAAGNRTQAGSTTFSHNALNRLTSASDGTTYGYDGAGRMTTKTKLGQTTSYTWDALDQLSGVDDGQSPITYSYDALGRRSERTENGTTETAHYGDLSDRPTLDTGAGGAIARSWVRGTSGLVEERSGSATSYPLADDHGDVTAMLDQSGAVSTRHTYDPWGTATSGPEIAFGYLGAQQRRTDTSSDLVQMGIRPYVPALGQFQAEDPVLGIYGIGQSLSRYGYVVGRPLKLYDLNGRSFCGPCDDIGNAAGDVVDTVSGIARNPRQSAEDVADFAGDRATDLFGSDRLCEVNLPVVSVGISTDEGDLHPTVGGGPQIRADVSCQDGPTDDVSGGAHTCWVTEEAGGGVTVDDPLSNDPYTHETEGYWCRGIGGGASGTIEF